MGRWFCLGRPHDGEVTLSGKEARAKAEHVI
jgi:hypothetical protein